MVFPKGRQRTHTTLETLLAEAEADLAAGDTSDELVLLTEAVGRALEVLLTEAVGTTLEVPLTEDEGRALEVALTEGVADDEAPEEVVLPPETIVE